MNAKTLILAILNFHEATGYEIHKMCTEGAYTYFVDISYGSIYPTLAKLESDQLVTSRLEQDAGKPERKVYSISEQGRLEFIRAVSQPPAKDKFKSEFLLVAMTAEYGTRESVAKAIDMRIKYLRQELEMITSHTVDCADKATCWVGDYGVYIKQCDLDYLLKNRDALLELVGSRLKHSKAAAE